MEQIAREVDRGINIEDLDDSFHTSSDTRTEHSSIESRASQQFSGSNSSRTLGPFEAHAFQLGQRNVARTCLNRIHSAVTFSASAGSEYATKAWLDLKDLRQSFWWYLNQPLVVGIVFGIPFAILQGWVSANHSNKNTPPVQCSSYNDKGASIREAVYSATRGLLENADLSGVEVLVTLPNGHVTTVVLDTPQSAEATPKACGVSNVA